MATPLQRGYAGGAVSFGAARLRPFEFIIHLRRQFEGFVRKRLCGGPGSHVAAAAV
jgi:hypothetical protein